MRKGAASSATSAGISAGGPTTEQPPDTGLGVPTPNFCLLSGEIPQFHDSLVEDDAVAAAAGAHMLQPLSMQPCPVGRPPSRRGGSHAAPIPSTC